jgi:hypothetical protein
MKVHVVVCFKIKWPTSLVGVTFLASSSSFQIGMDAVEYFFGLEDKVRTKDHPLARLDPVHRCTTTMAIQSFEGCHSETLLITIVV